MSNDNPTNKYRLLKPTPELKIGDEFIYTISGGSYAYFKDGNPNSKHWFFVENVENNPEWFELIPEPSKHSSQGDSRVEVTELGGMGGGKYRVGYIFYATSPIPKEKYPAIKQAIKRVLNNESWGILMPEGPARNPDGSLKKVNPEYTWESNEKLHGQIKDLELKLLNTQQELLNHIGKEYTKSEVDAMMENVWDASRQTMDGESFRLVGRVVNWLHNNFKDYLKTISIR